MRGAHVLVSQFLSVSVRIHFFPFFFIARVFIWLDIWSSQFLVKNSLRSELSTRAHQSEEKNWNKENHYCLYCKNRVYSLSVDKWLLCVASLC